MTEKQELRAWIKKRYPVGSVVYDKMGHRGEHTLTIKKSSVFEIREWDYAVKPYDPNIQIDFHVRDAGKHSPFFTLEFGYPKKWILSKYQSK